MQYLIQLPPAGVFAAAEALDFVGLAHSLEHFVDHVEADFGTKALDVCNA